LAPTTSPHYSSASTNRTLHAGPREHVDAAARLTAALHTEFGQDVAGATPDTPLERWGRVVVARATHTSERGEWAELSLRIATFSGRRFPRRRLGAVSLEERRVTPSTPMELGEAVQAAVDHDLPLLLSSEAASELHGRARVGRSKGRPGLLAITRAAGPSAQTRRIVAEQAIAELRELKTTVATVTLDAGARQLVRMTRARPLADDPVLLGRQRELAALKVVGSGVDASQTGTGKTITSGRAIAHRAATTSRLRAMIVAEGRLLGQWRDELLKGAPARGLPPLARTSTCSSWPTTRRSPDACAASTAHSATGQASHWWPTASSTATPASWPRSTGIC